MQLNYMYSLPDFLLLGLPCSCNAAFAKVCRESTEFHFEDIDVQLSRLQECVVLANREQKESKFQSSSLGSQNSYVNLTRGNASPEGGKLGVINNY